MSPTYSMCAVLMVHSAGNRTRLSAVHKEIQHGIPWGSNSTTTGESVHVLKINSTEYFLCALFSSPINPHRHSTAVLRGHFCG